MYKKLRNYWIKIVFAVLITISALVFIINTNTWNEYSKSYIASKNQIIDNYLDQIVNNLYNVLDSHAAWTDARDALNSKNSDWLNINATGYLVDQESYNVDFIYIASENEDFNEYYGKDYSINFKYLDTYHNVLEYNELSTEVIWIKNKPAFVAAMPFYDNNKENPTGCYIVGRILNDDEVKELRTLLSNNDVREIKFTKDELYPDVKLSKNHEVRASFPLLDGNNNYVNIFFHVDIFDKVFNKQFYSILGILLLTSCIIIIFFIFSLKKIVSKLSEIISVVKNISLGNYNEKPIPLISNSFVEINTLIKSFNSIAKNLESNNEIIREKYNEMIELLVNVVEMNDSYTYHHSFKVSEYVNIIGKAINFEDITNLELAAKLHDIGKISVPTEILTKPSKLTVDEYEIIKKHPEEGFKLLNEINIFKEASIGVLYHHERYDGNGYPKGLKGNEIPLISQIISVADVFEALTSDRSYRKAMSYENAMKILLNERGGMFNPELVDVFYNEMQKIKKSKLFA